VRWKTIKHIDTEYLEKEKGPDKKRHSQGLLRGITVMNYIRKKRSSNYRKHRRQEDNRALHFERTFHLGIVLHAHVKEFGYFRNYSEFLEWSGVQLHCEPGVVRYSLRKVGLWVGQQKGIPKVWTLELMQRLLISDMLSRVNEIARSVLGNSRYDASRGEETRDG